MFSGGQEAVVADQWGQVLAPRSGVVRDRVRSSVIEAGKRGTGSGLRLGCTLLPRGRALAVRRWVRAESSRRRGTAAACRKRQRSDKQEHDRKAYGMANGEVPEGLRERKRRTTRAAIERAAIMLVDERGYDSVTVAQICSRADVSQGTFFNYFPTKDAAIVGIGTYDLDPSAVHAAYDRLMPASMFHATLTLFLQVVGSFDWESDVAALRSSLVKGTPELMKMFLNNTFEFVEDFRVIVASYLEAHPEARTCADALTPTEEAGVVVAQALEAAKFALSRVADNPGAGLPSAKDVETVIRRVVG